MGNRLPDPRPVAEHLFKGAHGFFQLLFGHGGKVDIAHQTAFTVAGGDLGLADVEFKLLLRLRLRGGLLCRFVRGGQKILEDFILLVR